VRSGQPAHVLRSTDVLDDSPPLRAGPAGAVYQALIDPAAVARLRVPAGMTSHVHTFDARDGGTFRIS